MFKWLNDWFNPLSWIKYFTQKPANRATNPKNSEASSASNPNKHDENKEPITSLKRKEQKPPSLPNLNAIEAEVTEAAKMLNEINIPGTHIPDKQEQKKLKFIAQKDPTSPQDKEPKQTREPKKKTKNPLKWFGKKVGEIAKNLDPTSSDKEKLKYKMVRASNSLGIGGSNIEAARANVGEARNTNSEQVRLQNIQAATAKKAPPRR